MLYRQIWDHLVSMIASLSIDIDSLDISPIGSQLCLPRPDNHRPSHVPLSDFLDTTCRARSDR